MSPVDKKDLIILTELVKNSRISYSDLAEIVKLSVPAVISRIEKLSENGIIENFSIDINYNLLTEGKANIVFLKVPYKQSQNIAETLYSNPLVRKIFFTSGKYNIVIFTNLIVDKQKSEFISWITEEIEFEEMEILFAYDELPEKKEFTIEKPIDIKLICDFCKREFSGDIFSKVIGGKKRYFCCTTCLGEFEKRFQEEKT